MLMLENNIIQFIESFGALFLCNILESNSLTVVFYNDKIITEPIIK